MDRGDYSSPPDERQYRTPRFQPSGPARTYASTRRRGLRLCGRFGYDPAMAKPSEMRETIDVFETVPRLAWRTGEAEPGFRHLAEEVAVALVHDASTTAVMMATPSDLEDFGLGFSLTEGLIARPSQMQGLELVETDLGIEVRMWLDQPSSAALTARHRRLAGPTGCGLCGVESLAEAGRSVDPVVDQLELSFEQVRTAMAALGEAQALNEVTHAVHGAGYWSPAAGLVAVREDVGRHNALDKLAGALARRGAVGPGAVVLTSRVSVEMVQKAAVIGAPILIAASAPTALAVRTAEAAAITLVAVARRDGFEVFTRPERIVGE
jgi:FdhD protein